MIKSYLTGTWANKEGKKNGRNLALSVALVDTSSQREKSKEKGRQEAFSPGLNERQVRSSKLFEFV